MKNISYKNAIALLAVSFIISVSGIIFAVIMPFLVHDYSEDNTTEYSSTFVSIEKDKKDFLITVEEYECKLMIEYEIIIDLNAIQEISEGEIIYFRLPGTKNLLSDKNASQHTVLSLRTENKNIATLESLHNFEVMQNKNMQIIIIIVAIIFILIFVIATINISHIFLLKRKNQKK